MTVFRRPSMKAATVFGAAAVVLAGLVAVSLIVLAPRVGSDAPAPARSPGPDYALPVEPPPTVAELPLEGVSGYADPGWVARVSAASGIPVRALDAYAGAAIAKARVMPSCGLGWTTLAAIGLVESDHGRHGGSTVGEDGTVTPPIFGVALDGSSSAHIPDSDGGLVDGDAEYDRAVGPMQLIPQTWRNWHTDGNRDGVEDPQNIYDAVNATSNYLCRASGDMVSRDGWRAGVLAFNDSAAYVQSVANAANRYSKDAATAGN